MTERDFQRIESSIGRPLSAAFRSFMANPPPALDDSQLLVAAKDILELNRSGATADWPANQLAIGDNGCGDIYSVDLDDERGAVYLSGPHSGFESPAEDGYFERVFDSLPRLAQHLIRMREGS
jgi:hypothetical protein